MNVLDIPVHKNVFLFKHIFKGIDEVTIRFLLKDASFIILRKQKNTGQEFLLMKKIYCLAEGEAYFGYINNQGKKIIVEKLERGDIFEYNFMENSNSQFDSLYIEPFTKAPIKLFVLNPKSFRDAVIYKHRFACLVLENTITRIMKLLKKIKELELYNMEDRIMDALVELGDKKNGDITHDGELVIREITHEKLAESIGTSRETVSKTISQLKSKGIVLECKKRKITLKRNAIKIT